MVRSLKKHRDAGPFLQPVDPIKLNIPDYPEIIKQPMDLSTVEKKLKSQQYPNVAQFKADLKLVFDNCYLYNGKDSPIGLMAQNLEKVFGNQIQNMPSREEPAHAAVTSTIAAAAATTPTGTTTTASAPAGSRVRNARKSLAGRSPYKEDESPERSESRQQRRVSATSPRPKRLHVGMPENQHKFCASVIKEFKKKSHANIAFPFLQPVDWVALNIPDYPQVIKNPMDISTIKRKLDAGEYQTSNIFEADVRLMFQNCYTYNPPQNPVHEAGRALEAVFDAKWVGLPPVPPSRASPASPAHREKTPQSASQTINHEDTNNHIEVGHDESPKSSQIKDLEKNLKEMHKQLEDLKRAESMKQVATVGGGVRSRSAVPGQPQSRTSPTPEGKRGKGRNRGRGSRSGNRSASKVATIEHNGAEEALTFEQKKALSSRIETLPAERLQVVLDIIKSAYPDINEDEEEIELDIEMLDKATLRRLYDYAVLGKDNAASSSYSAVGSQRVPEYLESDQSKRSQLEEKLRQLDSVKNSGSTPRHAELVVKTSVTIGKEETNKVSQSPSDILMHFKKLKENEKRLFNRSSTIDHSMPATPGGVTNEELKRIQDRRQADEQYVKRQHEEIKRRLDQLSRNPPNLLSQKAQLTAFERELFSSPQDIESTEIQRQERIRALLGLPAPPSTAGSQHKHHGESGGSQPRTPRHAASPSYPPPPRRATMGAEGGGYRHPPPHPSQAKGYPAPSIKTATPAAQVGDSDLEEGELIE
ncbi:hypothetical protein EV182_000138 [Spiromyces aspiralis]|uniref:Uncharacterized protein n=1 Tax=Spiromyces aspiralis TaxID=68401 RepID=A0ACC1HXE4_9FUNG|nr:hypothetical protein EV182_000138 [Spiromyces aspiralis]